MVIGLSLFASFLLSSSLLSSLFLCSSLIPQPLPLLLSLLPLSESPLHLIFFLLLFLGIQLCYCRYHSYRQSTMSELSTKKLPFKNTDLEETCILRYLPPFLAMYKTQHYTEYSTACSLHDSSQKNWVKMAICTQYAFKQVETLVFRQYLFYRIIVLPSF